MSGLAARALNSKPALIKQADFLGLHQPPLQSPWSQRQCLFCAVQHGSR